MNEAETASILICNIILNMKDPVQALVKHSIFINFTYCTLRCSQDFLAPTAVTDMAIRTTAKRKEYYRIGFMSGLLGLDTAFTNFSAIWILHKKNKICFFTFQKENISQVCIQIILNTNQQQLQLICDHRLLILGCQSHFIYKAAL